MADSVGAAVATCLPTQTRFFIFRHIYLIAGGGRKFRHVVVLEEGARMSSKPLQRVFSAHTGSCSNVMLMQGPGAEVFEQGRSPPPPPFVTQNHPLRTRFIVRKGEPAPSAALPPGLVSSTYVEVANEVAMRQRSRMSMPFEQETPSRGRGGRGCSTDQKATTRGGEFIRRRFFV